MIKTGIIVNSLDEGVRVYGDLAQDPAVALYILLTKKPNETAWQFFVRLAGAFILRGHRLKKLRFLSGGRVAVFPRPLSHPRSLATLERLGLDIGLHRSENIYKAPVIRLFKEGILNFHIALLPKYRGRSVLEWTILNDDEVGATVFFIDEGIDTGNRIVLTKTIPRSSLQSVQQGKAFLFSLAGSVYAEAISALSKQKAPEINDAGLGSRYYVMSNLFREVVDQILQDPGTNSLNSPRLYGINVGDD